MCLNIQTFSDYIIYTFTNKKKRKKVKHGDWGDDTELTVQISSLKHSSPGPGLSQSPAAISPLFHAVFLGTKSDSSRYIIAGKEDTSAIMQTIPGVASVPHGVSR